MNMGCDDIIIWPDGTWCYVSEFSEYAFMSDDFEVISQGTLKYIEFHKELDNA